MAAIATPDPVSITLERAKQILSEEPLEFFTVEQAKGLREMLAERRAAANSIVSLYQSNKTLNDEVTVLDAQLVESNKEKADLIAQLDRERARSSDAARDVKATGQRGSSAR